MLGSYSYTRMFKRRIGIAFLMSSTAFSVLPLSGNATTTIDGSGNITTTGTSTGVTVTAASQSIGDITIDVADSATGVNNTGSPEVGYTNILLSGTTVNVTGGPDAIGILTGRTLNSSSTLTTNVSGSGTGLQYSGPNDSELSRIIVTDVGYTINLTSASTDAVGVRVNTSGTFWNRSTVNVAGTDGTGILVENASTVENHNTIEVTSTSGTALRVLSASSFTNYATITSASSSAAVDLTNVTQDMTVTNSDTGGTISAADYETLAIAGGSGNDTFLMEGTVLGVVDTGAGNDTVTWDEGSITGSISLGEGGTESLTANGVELDTLYRLDGGTEEAGETKNKSLYLQNITYHGGTFETDDAYQDRVKGVNLTNWDHIYLEDNTAFTLTGNLDYTTSLTLDSTSTLYAGNGVNATIGETGSTFTNAGTIDLTNGGNLTGDVLTIAGNYVGVSGSQLRIDTTLNGDTSPTDMLVIEGNSSGSTLVTVIASSTSLGAWTYNGIKIVQVDGTSDAVFTLNSSYIYKGEAALVAGAYSYVLVQGSVDDPTDGDWYLRSYTDKTDGPKYAPGVPVYENLTRALEGFNRLPTLQQRVGNRYWQEPQGTDGTPISHGKGSWVRIEGTHADFKGSSSTTDSSYQQGMWKIQGGFDGELKETANGVLFGGLNVQYGTISTSVDSIYSNGKIDTKGYGLGATLTWYQDNGFYVDGQAEVNRYTNDLSTDAAGTMAEGVKGNGYALSIEAGQRYHMENKWTLIPQAQLMYSRLSVSSFRDKYDTDVTPAELSSLIGRLGVALQRQYDWKNGAGEARHAEIYGIANIYDNFSGNVLTTDVAGTPITSVGDRLTGELGLGASITFDRKVDLYAEARYAVSLENPGDNKAVSGNVGIRWRW